MSDVEPRTEEARAKLHELARLSGSLADRMLKSRLGADVVDAESYYCARLVYVAVADGADFAKAFDDADKRWRAYAEAQNRKVAKAPKVRRGPMSGHSVISHRWVYPDRFATMRVHLHLMCMRAISGT